MIKRNWLIRRIDFISIYVVFHILSAIVAAQTAQAEIFMSISGSVTAAVTGQGIPGLDIIAGGTTNNQSFLATTDASGKYTMKIVPEGEYRIKILETPVKYVLQPYVKTVVVEKGKNVVNAIFELPLAGSVSGTLYKSSGTPLTDAPVYAVTDKGVAISKTDSSGRYTLTGLMPALVTKLHVFTYGYGMATVDNILITAGQVTANINITLPADVTAVKGIVASLDSVGVPVANAYVLITGPNGLGITMTDFNGNYSIQGLPSGLYEAVIAKIGFERVKIGNIVVTSGQITNQNFTLPPQQLPLITGFNESVEREVLTLNFKIDNPEYPYAGLQFQVMGTGACGCVNVSFTGSVIVGVSVGHSWCRCAQQCGSTNCWSSYSVTSICACMGFDLSVSGQGQYCNSLPTSGFNNSISGSIGVTGIPVGLTGTYQWSGSGACYGVGGDIGHGIPIGPVNVSATWCSCYDFVRRM